MDRDRSDSATLHVDEREEVAADNLRQEQEWLTMSRAAWYLSVSEPVLRLMIRANKTPTGRVRSGRKAGA